MLTIFLIAWPFFASMIILILRPQNAKAIALAASLVEFIASLVVVYQFNRIGVAPFIVQYPWVGTMGIMFSVGIDGINLLLILLTTLLIPFIILSTRKGAYDREHIFYGLTLFMQMALIGVFTALDGFLFYVFWELALIPIYFICLMWGGENRAKVTLKFFIYTLAGSLMMLIALLYLYNKTTDPHSFNIQALYAAGWTLSEVEQGWIFWAFFLAFAIKMPVFPFHTWQPDTYTESPVQGTMLLSAIMLKMGIFGVIRWLIPMVPLGVSNWSFTAIILSVIGIVYASCIAIVQKDYKRLIAYSSIAHVGLIAAGVFTLNKIGIQGAMIQMLSHGIIVFALFYIIDIIALRTQTRQIGELGGIRNLAPVLTTVFIVVMLGSVALPFTSSFVGEFLLINALVQYKFALGAIAGLTTILGAVYMFRAFQTSVLGEVATSVKNFIDLTTQEKVVLYPIVILIIAIGVYPAPLLSISESAVNDLLVMFSDFSASIK